MPFDLLVAVDEIGGHTVFAQEPQNIGDGFDGVDDEVLVADHPQASVRRPRGDRPARLQPAFDAALEGALSAPDRTRDVAAVRLKRFMNFSN